MELQTTQTPWPTIHEAAEILGVSVRTVQVMMQDGRLRKAKRPERGSTPMTILDPDDVARERAQRHATSMPAPRPPNTEVMSLMTQVVETLAAAIPKQDEPRPELPLNLTLDAAAAYSGLPPRLLLKAIRDKRLAAWNWHKEIYISREDLENLRPETNPIRWSDPK